MLLANLLAIWTPSFYELLIILVIALLLFGKRLPEVARSLGKGIVEFKKGVKGVEEDVNDASSNYPQRAALKEPRDTPGSGG
jgi:sec-independent protein translocase protein TatA